MSDNADIGIISERWTINTTPVELVGEDRTFGGNELFIEVIPKTCWFTNVYTQCAPKTHTELSTVSLSTEKTPPESSLDATPSSVVEESQTVSNDSDDEYDSDSSLWGNIDDEWFDVPKGAFMSDEMARLFTI